MSAVVKVQVGRAGFRRYPALGFLVAAALLALLLPSSLRVPLTGPPSVAELAPVPSKDRSTSNGALSALGAASSGGLGAGAAPDSGGVGDASGAPLPAQRHPRGKRCVGTPPRQTEDPLSPPCVAFFDGDNGGTTARGVTKDEVTVVIVYDSSSGPQILVDLDGAFGDADNQRSNNSNRQRMAKAFARFFNDRYQTYDRHVHFWGYTGGGGSVEQLRASVAFIDGRLHPFAIVPSISAGVQIIAEEASKRGILSASFDAFERPFYAANSPRVISFRPDLENEAELTATFICRKLARRPVKHGDAADVGKTRRIGILYSDQPDEPSYAQRARLLAEDLRRDCDVAPPAVATSHGSGTQDTAQQNAVALASLRADGVTSVVPYSGDTVIYANNGSWKPEWIVPGSNGLFQIDNNGTARLLDPSSWRNAVGITFDFRRGPMRSQTWWQAFHEGCTDCADVTSIGNEPPAAYEALAMLMYGIQAGGPKLTLASLDKGLHAIPARPSTSPNVPAAYFGSDWSFEKDAMAIWWDPAGDAPGDSRPGCYRLPYDGARARAGEWPSGDQDLFSDGQPCQGSFVN